MSTHPDLTFESSVGGNVEAVYYGVRIGTSTLSEFNKSSRVPITRKKF